MIERLSRVGAAVGNWNDRQHGADSRAEQTRRWRAIDRISSWLYTRPDRR